MHRAKPSIVCLDIFLLALALLASPHAARAQWVDTHCNHEANSFTVSGTNLFASYISVYKTPDDGTTWTQANTGLNGQAGPLATVGANLLAGTWGAGVFRSTDQGQTWAAANSGLTNAFVNAFAVSGGNVFTATQGGGVFRSTDGGLSWIHCGTLVGDCGALLVSGANLFVGGASPSPAPLSRSTDNGATWTLANSGLTNPNVRSFAVIGPILFAGTGGGGVFKSVDNGTTWTAANSGLLNLAVTSLAVSGSCLIAGTNAYGGVYLSADNGAHWGKFGLNNESVWALVVKGASVFAGTSYTVKRRAAPDAATAVEQTSGRAPARCALDQNYPNPVRRSTAIGFALPQGAYVTIDVFNLLGERVASVLAEYLPAGTYRTSWDAKNVASGEYLLRLHAGSDTATRKLVVAR